MVSVQLEQVILWKLRDEFYVAVEIVLLYVFFEFSIVLGRLLRS